MAEDGIEEGWRVKSWEMLAFWLREGCFPEQYTGMLASDLDVCYELLAFPHRAY